MRQNASTAYQQVSIISALPVRTPMAAVLGSWKEIATFLGKGVRTVQRWERDLSLPIHRPPGRGQGVVIAFPGELTDWAKRQYRSGNGAGLRRDEIERMHQLRNSMADSAAKLHDNAQKLAENTSRIVANMHVLEGKQKKTSLKASAQPAI